MPENTFFLTKEGLKKIKKEHEKLLSFRDMKAKGEVPSIWHSEDVNPEYLAYQEDITLLESRIAEFENIIQNAQLIKTPKNGRNNTVGLGARVTVDFGGEIDEFTIVGTLEADPLQKKISTESPIGRGLLGARIGDTIKIKTTLINHDCRILKIVYHSK